MVLCISVTPNLGGDTAADMDISGEKYRKCKGSINFLLVPALPVVLIWSVWRPRFNAEPQRAEFLVRRDPSANSAKLHLCL
jgi:hypothetical protein